MEKGAALWRFALLVLKRASKKFMKDSCLLKAQALAYTSLFAFVPVSVVSLSVLSQFRAFAKWEEAVRGFLFQNLLPGSSQKLQGYLAQFTERATALGIIGLLGSILTAVFLLDTIERTFNEIWALRRRRQFILRFISFWAFLTLVPLLLGASIYTSSVFSRYVKIQDILWIDRLSWFIFPYSLAVLGFFAAYRFLPYAETSSKAAIVAALVAALLWEISKRGFDLYVTHVLRISRVYGSLGLFPIFLLWLYLVWLMVLFGAELAYVIQFPKGKRGYGLQSFLHVIYRVAQRFISGLPPLSIPDLARETGLYREDLERIVDILEKKGWFVPTNGGVALAFSPEMMPLTEAVQLGEKLSLNKVTSEDSPPSVEAIVKQLRNNVFQQTAQYSVMDLLRGELTSPQSDEAREDK